MENICGKCGKPMEICSAAIYIRAAADKLQALDMKQTIYYLNLASNLMKQRLPPEEQDK